MKTCCPKCSTLYNVTDEQLNMADSKVRCASCQHVFDGREFLTDKVNILPKNTHDNESLGDINLSILSESPSKHLWIWISTCLIASLFLLAQFLWLNKSEFSENPHIGKTVSLTCDLLSFCTIPQKRDQQAFTLISRQLYSHPNEQNALILSASFSNKAQFSQPYPLLLVSMSDKQGEIIAERYFKPKEYLDRLSDNKTTIIKSQLMPAGEQLNINLALGDPGKEALAFEIDFL